MHVHCSGALRTLGRLCFSLTRLPKWLITRHVISGPPSFPHFLDSFLYVASTSCINVSVLLTADELPALPSNRGRLLWFARLSMCKSNSTPYRSRIITIALNDEAAHVCPWIKLLSRHFS
jgi:hypothetical protein